MIVVVRGDITKIEAHAIVNPANSFGTMGGGVALALKEKGGEEIEEEAISKAPIKLGTAVETTAGSLKAKYVIHSPTMEETEEEIGSHNVAEATRAALEKAKEIGAKIVAFPAMGTGVGGLSAKEAADVMIDEIKKHELDFKKIIIVCYTDEAFEEFSKLVE